MSGGSRESLCVIDAAIERLKSIKGRVYHSIEYCMNLSLNVSTYFEKMIDIPRMTTNNKRKRKKKKEENETSQTKSRKEIQNALYISDLN